MNHIASPRTDDATIEDEIQRKGKTAPRVTPANIEANIANEYYFTAGQGVCGAAVWGLDTAEFVPGTWANPRSSIDLLTFCVLELKNGFTVTGESACASPENFDAEIGKKIARQNAVNRIWPLMGYALKERLHRSAQQGCSEPNESA